MLAGNVDTADSYPDDDPDATLIWIQITLLLIFVDHVGRFSNNDSM